MTTPTIDSVAFFDALAAEMNEHPEDYEVLGDVDLDLVLVMERPDDDPFRVRLRFVGITCDGIAEASPGDEQAAHCWIEAPISVWQAMFDNIVDNGRAVGLQTLNALTMLGEEMCIRGADPMGTDRVSRFNQTLQQFLDGAGKTLAAARS